MQASTALSAAFTPFTLAKFTQSIMVNLTNVNGTNQNPTGMPSPVAPGHAGMLAINMRWRSAKRRSLLGMPSIM